MTSIDLTTDDKLEYTFYPNLSGSLQFRVQAGHDAHIALSTEQNTVDPLYEVFIGGWENTKSIIRKNGATPDVAVALTPNILDDSKLSGFKITWDNGSINVSRERKSKDQIQEPFLSWTDSDPITTIKYIGVCTGWGATGIWNIQPDQSVAGAPDHNWVEASDGEVPIGAVWAGEDNGELMYVIRANFKQGIIPGKLVPSHGKAYIPWNGKGHSVQKYEVLCDFDGEWVRTSGGNIPNNALPAGESESDRPETFYVGRVVFDGDHIIGKFQPSHGVLYIVHKGKEEKFSNFEVLCRK